MIKIYFCGSIRGGRGLAEKYGQIVKMLQNFGTVLTEHIADKDIIEKEAESQTDEEIYIQDRNWLEESDIVIAEVTTPSLGVGFEIGYAIRMKKPILCLYNNDADFDLSAMISGCPDLSVVKYQQTGELRAAIEKFIINNSIKSVRL